MADYKTKAPSGLKLTRKGNAVILEWKISDSDYSAGEYVYRDIHTWKRKLKAVKKGKKTVKKYVGISDKDHHEQWVNARSTSFTTTINTKKYYPHTKLFLTNLSFGVQGKRANFQQNSTNYYPSWSDITKLSKKVEKPRAPKVYSALSSTNYNVSVFTWNEVDANTSFHWFTDFERETILKQDCSEKNGSKISWTGATSYTGSSRSHTVTEDSAIFKGFYSYTRWYRVRCRGPRGESDWKYAKHVYAIPAPAKNVTAKVDARNEARGYYRVNVSWTADATNAHPIDSTTIEYLSTTPNTKRTTEKDKNGVQYSHTELIPPTMSSGTSVGVIKDTGGKDAIVFSVPAQSDEDKCIVVRVNTKHDNNVYNGETTYVTGSFGKLAKPEIDSIGTVDPTTGRVLIQATNKSEVPNTHLAILYKTIADPSDVKVIGIIPSGKNEATVILPPSYKDGEYKIGVYARCGDYSPVRPTESEPTYFNLSNGIITSGTTWGDGAVPMPPQSLELSSPSIGTIRVKWDWSWRDATGTELSWSDHEDAWESTDEPTTYVVNNTSASVWNIHGLSIGTWYVRARLFRTTGDMTVYGAYSEIFSIKLSSAPSIPSLTLSESVITETGEVTCYWAYISTDGTEQQQAEICEATKQEDGSFAYGNVIARSSTMQYVTILAEEQGWKSGEIHYLAVRVTSASGETSEGWSSPVAVTIANKVDITVRATSLDVYSETIEDQDEQVVNRYNVLSKLPFYISFGLAEPYVKSEDVTVVEGKTYYIKENDQYISPPEFKPDPSPYYEKIVTPLSYDPSSFGYYEVDPEDDLAYILTEDTSWDYAKTYYSRIGEGTEEDPYTYEEVTPLPTERIEYVLTADTNWDDLKEYYFRSGSDTFEDPYIYSIVTKPIESPANLDYYEYQDVEGEATLIIERAESYHVLRPDDGEYDGFEGETIAIINQTNGGTTYFEQEDLIGVLDDGAAYRLLVSIVDTYGQVSEAEPVEFIVHWAHQAVIPNAEVETFDEDIYATIRPIAPTGYELTTDTSVIEDKKYFTRSGEGTEESPYIYTEVENPSGDPEEQGYYQLYDYSQDRCNIYRLSTDAPQLIVADAEFGTKYVDPYPTLKSFGGYRVSYKTVNGDYITDDNRLAISDYTDPDEHQIDRFLTIIDFNRDRVILPYDLELSNSWSKDFTETKYLGGSVQGDWNPAVSRTGSVRTTTIVFEDPDTIRAMRRLADYPGICHIRTPDGSNYTANVNISEDRENKMIGQIAKFSLDITRVDPEDLDGKTYASWTDNQ